MPHLFGRGGRDRVLVCLAANGAMHVRAIARAIGSDSRKTFDMVEQLIKAGLVVKRQHNGGRKYVQIDRRLPVYPSLLKLLLKLDEHWPAKRVDRRVARWYMPFKGAMATPNVDAVFQSPVRSRVLLFVAAAGLTDMETIRHSTQLGPVSILYAVNHWEREGVLRSDMMGRHRIVKLNQDFEAASELETLLREMIIRLPEYRGLRVLARKRMKHLKVPTP